MRVLAQRLVVAPLLFLAGSADPALAEGGFYVGAFGGYGGGVSSQHDDGFRPATASVMQAATAPSAPMSSAAQPTPLGPDPITVADGAYRLGSGVGGALVGYGRDVGRIYLGVEGDFAYAGINGNSTACGGVSDQCGTAINLQGDARVRIGVPYGAFMPFIAGGASFAHERAYDTFYGVSGSAWRTGWTVGGGVEYKVAPHVGVRAEYLHSDYGSARLFDIVPGVGERVRTSTDVVRIGVTYTLDSFPSISMPFNSLMR